MLSGSVGMHPSLGMLLVALVVIGLVARRSLRARALKVERLWIRPVIFALIVSATVGASPLPLDGVSLAVIAVSLVLGVAMGWQRGKFMRITVDPETHALTSQASPLGMVFILAILGLRVALRGALLESHSAFGISAAAVTDGLVILLGGMMVAQGAEMWLRAQRLLDEARAAKAAMANSTSQPPIVS